MAEEAPASTRGETSDRPVQIVKIDDESEEHNFILDEGALNEILNKDNIRDKPVCIISVAGQWKCDVFFWFEQKIYFLNLCRCLQKRQIIFVKLHATIFGEWRCRQLAGCGEWPRSAGTPLEVMIVFADWQLNDVCKLWLHHCLLYCVHFVYSNSQLTMNHCIKLTNWLL